MGAPTGEERERCEQPDVREDEHRRVAARVNPRKLERKPGLARRFRAKPPVLGQCGDVASPAVPEHLHLDGGRRLDDGARIGRNPAAAEHRRTGEDKPTRLDAGHHRRPALSLITVRCVE